MHGAPVQCLLARLELGRLCVGAGYQKMACEVAQRQLPHFTRPYHFTAGASTNGILQSFSIELEDNEPRGEESGPDQNAPVQ